MAGMKHWLRVVIWVVYGVCLYGFPAAGMAQIRTDGSLGNGTAVDIPGPDHVIPADVGETAGDNLFHSFDVFNVPTNGSATFTGPGNIENIVGRVTGGEISNIDGVVASTIDGANVFLINPAGIVLGENARLDVGGSFYISTADELYFEDGGVFRVQAGTGEVFSRSSPRGFGFLDGPVGNITVNSRDLEVPSGETLGIIGGDITIAGGTLQAPGGTVAVVSVADDTATGEVSLNAAVSEGMTLGEVTITGAALAADGDGGGLVVIRSGQLTVVDTTISAGNSGNADRHGASIDIEVTDTFVLDDSELSVDSRATGRSGDVIVSAGVLDMKNDAAISTASRGLSSGGNIEIRADRVQLTDGAVISTDARDDGRGGDVVVQAGVLDMSGAVDIVTSSRGRSTGGKVEIRADRVQLADGASISTEASNSGRGGDVDIEADIVSLSTNAQITSNTSTSREGAGNLIITAHQELRITEPDGGQTGIFALGGASSEIGEIRINGGALIMDGGVIGTPAGEGTRSDAAAGNITVTVRSIELKGGATIDSSTLGDATGGDIVITAEDVELSENAVIVAGASGRGRAGTIRIDANRIVVTGEGSSIRSSASAAGAGGSISLHAETVTLAEGAEIAADSSGSGNAGTVSIEAQTLSLNQSTITTEAAASGGTITIDVHRLELQDSQVTASVQGAGDTVGGDIDIHATGSVIVNNSMISASAEEGRGGNIDIHATDLVFLSNATISASAEEGQGGNIDIETRLLLRDHASDITATGGTDGTDGVVDIRAVRTDVSSNVTPLPQRFASALPLSQLRCAQRLRGGQISSFVVAGRAGLPVDPSGGLPSFLVDLPSEMSLVSSGQSFDGPIAAPAASGWYPCPQERPRVAQR